jgi:hypothetical protein
MSHSLSDNCCLVVRHLHSVKRRFLFFRFGDVTEVSSPEVSKKKFSIWRDNKWLRRLLHIVVESTRGTIAREIVIHKLRDHPNQRFQAQPLQVTETRSSNASSVQHAAAPYTYLCEDGCDACLQFCSSVV